MSATQTISYETSIPRTSLHKIVADGVRVFYRAVGPLDAPVILLLHGFPTSSHMFRELISRLATHYRVIAPDLPGFGFTTILEEGNREIQSDFLLNYASNIALYPVFQKYFREAHPPLLAIWGKNDPFFTPAGAEAFLKDNPNATVELLDTGHFALETHVDEIASSIHRFLSPVGSR